MLLTFRREVAFLSLIVKFDVSFLGCPGMRGRIQTFHSGIPRVTQLTSEWRTGQSCSPGFARFPFRDRRCAIQSCDVRATLSNFPRAKTGLNDRARHINSVRRLQLNGQEAAHGL
jgi:hypothetical protein